MKIKPVRCVALIKPDKVEDKSAGGLYLPESARERDQIAMDKGVLVAIGEGFFDGLSGPVPEVGDKIMFDKYAGSLVTIDRDKYRLVNDDKIIAILEE